MTGRSLGLSDALQDYVVAHSEPADVVLSDLASETAALGSISSMQIAADQGAFLTLLTRLVGARRALEIGTFTGYSSICIARGLAEGGRLLCCDVSEEWTGTARRYWDRAGVADRIELRIGPALDTVRALPAEPDFDLAFIDADKTGYPDYWEEVVPRVRPGGLVLVDNVLRHGEVADPAMDDEGVRAVRSMNDRAVADDRVDVVLLPLADGLTVARRR
ncbi:MAG: O-methyltransferase [Motilibacteraceae bacterium]